MELILATDDAGIIDALTRYMPQVRCIAQPNIGDLNEWQYDSVLLMGNGYGILEDAHGQVINELYPNAEFNIRETISEDFGGMVPVGAAVSTPLTDDPHAPGWLIYAPTGRLPGAMSEPSSVYWAFRAGFYQARLVGDVKQLLIALYGLEHLPLMSVIAQLRLAYEHVFMGGVDDSNWDTIGRTESAIAVAVGTH